MTAYTHTELSQRFGHLRAHLPAYLVGIGATAALTAGAFVIFLSLAAFVTFNGLPFAGSSDDAGAAYLDSTSAAPAAAATALGAGPGAVAKSAAPGSNATSPAARSAAAAAAGSGGAGDPSGTGSSGKAPAGPGVSTSPGDVAAPPIAVPLPSTSGPVTDVVQGVDSAAGTNLSGPAGGAAGTADGAANQAGGAAGRAGLGGPAGGAVRGVTDRALGGGGLAGSLLGG
jgi:hypothetical protein